MHTGRINAEENKYVDKAYQKYRVDKISTEFTSTQNTIQLHHIIIIHWVIFIEKSLVTAMYVLFFFMKSNKKYKYLICISWAFQVCCVNSEFDHNFQIVSNKTWFDVLSIQFDSAHCNLFVSFRNHLAAPMHLHSFIQCQCSLVQWTFQRNNLYIWRFRMKIQSKNMILKFSVF